MALRRPADPEGGARRITVSLVYPAGGGRAGGSRRYEPAPGSPPAPTFGMGGPSSMVCPMRVVLIVLMLALVLYSLLDCARTPEENMPARMPKFLWVALIILFPAVGSIAWIIVSRVKAAEERGGYVEPTVWSSKEGTSFRRPERPRALGPDDDPDFLRNLEQGIRRRKHHPGSEGDGAGAAAGSADGTGRDSTDTDTRDGRSAGGEGASEAPDVPERGQDDRDGEGPGPQQP